MDRSLLKVKIQPPPIQPNLIERIQLTKHLERGLYYGTAFTRKVTLVSAPAGYGKSTLVRQWIEDWKSRVAWITIDEGDNDPVLFWSYFVTALQTFDPNLGNSLLAYLHTVSFSPSESSFNISILPENLLITLINELDELKDPIILVLDDFHLISNSNILDKMAFLIEKLPHKVHLVLITRNDPPWPLSRWRSRGVLVEIRQSDLRFSDREASEFMSSIMCLKLSREDISILNSRTEGWVTGLQMAGVSMREISDKDRFIKSFSSSNRYILDYLSEEVLRSQPEAVQSFLLHTSILNNLTAELCDAITGDNNGQCLLETLERSNLFIISLDEERRWYRYHTLFAGVLRHRLARTSPDLLLQLHLRASNWYRRMGIYVEAIEHAYKAQNSGLVADLIDESSELLSQQGEYTRLMRWLEWLPQNEFTERPRLFILKAFLLLREGRLSDVEEYLQLLDQITRQKLTFHDYLYGEVATLHAFLSLLKGDTEGICRYSNEALEALPSEDTFWRCGAFIACGDAHSIQNNLEGANQAYKSALNGGKNIGNPLIIFLAGQKMGLNLWNQGRLNDTAELCQRLLHYTETNHFACNGRGGTLWALWGDVLRERNQMKEAKEYIEKGYNLSETENMARGWCGYCLALLKFSEGDYEGAEKIFEELSSLISQSTLLSGFIYPLRVKIWLARNDLSSAIDWMCKRSITLDEKFYFMKEPEYLAIARIMTSEGRLEDAMAFLEKKCNPDPVNRRRTAIETFVLKALIANALGKHNMAHKLLREALTLAEPEGYTRAFLDEGPSMASLLQEAATGEGISAYGKRLLRLFANPRKEETKTIYNYSNHYIETLSKRELEVLMLASKGLSNKAIAEQLYISITTVKWHMSNILGKLGVDNRLKAVARAKDLGLLE